MEHRRNFERRFLDNDHQYRENEHVEKDHRAFLVALRSTHQHEAHQTGVEDPEQESALLAAPERCQQVKPRQIGGRVGVDIGDAEIMFKNQVDQRQESHHDK